jgi:hypothetical protein
MLWIGKTVQCDQFKRLKNNGIKIINEFEEFYLLAYNAVYSTESQPMFPTNMSPPSLGSKNKSNRKPARSR